MTASPTIRPLSDGEIEPAAAVLARAFAEDPQFLYGIPDAESRRKLFPTIFTLTLRYAYRFGTVTAVTEGQEIAGVTACLLMPEAEFSEERWETVGLRFTDPVLGPIAERVIAAEQQATDALMAAYPEPHFPIFQLGIDP